MLLVTLELAAYKQLELFWVYSFVLQVAWGRRLRASVSLLAMHLATFRLVAYKQLELFWIYYCRQSVVWRYSIEDDFFWLMALLSQ
jgi:hypothetical protein